jgi:Zn-dependent metalloprotease
MVRPFTPSRIALVAALACSSSVTAVWAAQPEAAKMRSMEASARAHIAAFPGRTLHAPEHSYQMSDAVLDDDGTQHVRFQRSFRGLPVIGGDTVVHSDRNGSFIDVSQTLDRLINISTRSATVTGGRAIKAALEQHAGSTRGEVPAQVVYARADTPVLAWDVRVYGEQADGTPSEKHVIVDAMTGSVLEAWDDIHTSAAAGTGKTLYSGTVALTGDLQATATYWLRDPNRGNQETVDYRNGTSSLYRFVDADNVWGTGLTSSTQSAAADAQYGAQVTWDYYKNVHGRTGIANNGVGAQSRVHYSTRYNNAFWSDSCFCMTYGDGDGTTFTPLVSLDVAGHEMSHGVTSRTAGLVYSGESGGLNEATSDIFGSMVEFYAANASDPGDYLIGEKIYRGGTQGLRSMINPSTDGGSADCWYSTVKNLDVHYSSGVANHFFYLLAQGTTNGSPSKTCVSGNTRVATGLGTLAGIGRAKAEKIWYRALTLYFTTSTTFSAARTATIRAAGDLYGVGGVEATAVANAWTAVGRP